MMTALFASILLQLSFSACNNKTKQDNQSPDQIEEPDSVNTNDLATLNLLIRRDPTNAALFHQRSKLFSADKNFREALSDVSIALSLDSLNPEFYISQAEYYIFNGQPNDAKNALEKCLGFYPGNTDVMLKMAEIHLYLKEYAKSQIVLREVISLDPDLAQIYFIQGLIALENSDSVMALRNMQTAIAKDPDHYAAYMQAGKISAGSGDPLAEQYYLSAIELVPESYEAHYHLGLYYQDQGFLDEANQQYDYIIDHIDSTVATPYYNKGYLQLIYVGNFEQAIDLFSEATRLEPKYADAWYNIGFAYELLGKLREARQNYEHVLTLQPNYPLAIKGLNRLDEGTPIKTK